MPVDPTPSRFNIRVYGLMLHDGHILVNEERIRGNDYYKFPGGGLELGEGIAEGLVREWKEELGEELRLPTQNDLFYLTDFFVPSAFDDSQVISVYYLVRAKQEPLARMDYVNTEPNERSFWMRLNELDEGLFALPIDKVVVRRLRDGLL